jgi:hypothetical protein
MICVTGLSAPYCLRAALFPEAGIERHRRLAAVLRQLMRRYAFHAAQASAAGNMMTAGMEHDERRHGT